MSETIQLTRGFTLAELGPVIKRSMIAALTGAEFSPKAAVHLTGLPGGGKTSAIGQWFEDVRGDVAAALGCKPERVGFFPIMLPNHEPTDLTGLCVPRGDGKKGARLVGDWTWPGLLPHPDDYDAAVVFIDELDKPLSPTIFGQVAQLMLEHRVGPHVLPERTFVIAASNPLSSMAGGRQLPSHLWNRMKNFKVIDDVVRLTEIFGDRGYAPWVIAWMNDRKHLLRTDFNPKASNPSFCTPRSLEEFCIEAAIQDWSTVGIWGPACVGDAAAADLIGYRDTHNAIPRPEKLRHMAPNDVAKELGKTPGSALYAAISVFADYCTTSDDVGWSIQAFAKYRPEYAMAYTRWLTHVAKKYSIALKSPEFIKYHVTEGVKLHA